MCGRFTLRTPATKLQEQFDLPLLAGLTDMAVESWRPRYNIAPSQPILALRLSAVGDREWALLRWGLIPSWADDPTIGNKLINARSETASGKPSFRRAFAQRRCLIPADGFYEWKGAGADKQPFLIQRRDGLPFALAGLWEHWDHGGEVVESATILTTSANADLRPLHDRMPVILLPEAYDPWLHAQGLGRDDAHGLLRPLGDDLLDYFPVSRLVNSPRHDSAELVEPTSPAEPATRPTNRSSRAAKRSRPANDQRTLWDDSDRPSG